MGKMIALLSGKGGSGKTTLALSMASMLANCGVKTLLVDCDLCTNGATYFFESRLSDDGIITTSFSDVMFNKVSDKIHYIDVNTNFDFLPSISKIAKDTIDTYSCRINSDAVWMNFQAEVASNYDVVVFDCQAGYADILKTILPVMDAVLFVMETDTISSSSIRSLYLKIGELVQDKKVYQVFNKASRDEYDIYSKLSGGTVFTNIETILFDWNIRNAFSMVKIPDMKNTNANYGRQIYNICMILFPEKAIQESLKQFDVLIQIYKNMQEESSLTSQIVAARKRQQELKNGNRSKIISTSLLLLTLCTCFALFAFIKDGESKDLLSLTGMLPLMIMGFIIIVLSIQALMTATKESRVVSKEMEIYKFKLDRLERENRALQNESRKIIDLVDSADDHLRDFI